MRAQIGKWTVTAVEDADGHLTLAAEHEDGSQVLDITDGAIAVTETEFCGRFSTRTLEDTYAALCAAFPEYAPTEN